MSDIECRVHIVHVFLIQLLAQQFDTFPKSLEMDDFPFPQELNHVIDIGVIGKPKNIIVGDSGFLFWFIT